MSQKHQRKREWLAHRTGSWELLHISSPFSVFIPLFSSSSPFFPSPQWIFHGNNPPRVSMTQRGISPSRHTYTHRVNSTHPIPYSMYCTRHDLCYNPVFLFFQFHSFRISVYACVAFAYAVFSTTLPGTAMQAISFSASPPWSPVNPLLSPFPHRLSFPFSSVLFLCST